MYEVKHINKAVTNYLKYECKEAVVPDGRLIPDTKLIALDGTESASETAKVDECLSRHDFRYAD